MSDWGLIGVSVAYVLLVIILAFLLSRPLGALYARKAAHIMVSFWILLCFRIGNPALRLMGPFAFTLLNWFASRRLKTGCGLAAYPAAVAALLLLQLGGLVSEATVITAVLVLGLGDGLAAVAGSLSGHKGKSLPGSLAMASVSLILFLLSPLPFPDALISSLAVSAVEYLTPGGYDNITVALSAALLREVLCVL